MKCPKCKLVTFDHLSKCPRCRASFDLSRRLTRRRNNPARKILIAAAPEDIDAARAARRPRPRTIAPATEPVPEAPAPTAPMNPAVLAAAMPSREPQPEPEKLTPPVPTNPAVLGAAMPGRSPEPQESTPPVPVNPAALDATMPGRELEPQESTPPVPVNPAVLTATMPAGKAEPVAVAALSSTEAAAVEVATASEAEVVTAPLRHQDIEELQAADARRLKDRMVLASQARRRQRVNIENECVDPALPDWYEPTPEEGADAAPVLAGSARKRA